MTAYDPTSSASHGDTPSAPTDLPREPASDITGDAQETPRPVPASDDAMGGNPPAGAGSTPQLEEPFWREQTSHVEAPLYRGDEPVIEPAAGAGERDRHDLWATGPVTPTSTSTAYPPAPSSPWSGADTPGPSFSAPLHSQTEPYGPPPSGLPYAPAGNASKPKRMRSAIIGTAVAAALIGGLAGAGTVALEDRSSSTTASAVLSSTGSTATTSAVTNGTVSAAAAKITPSVVTIQVVGSSESGTGSGVIVRSDGYILTNNHVVSVAGTGGSITVQTSDGRSAKATIVGTDSTDDLAVIKVTGLANLSAATFAKSSALTVGQSVVAIGAPLGLSDTVTSGIVSATARTVRSGDDNAAVFAAVQTDAAINPGNSGGALVDLNGNVIGINAAIASTGQSGVTVPGQQTTQSGNIGIGFAIPSDEASRIATELITTGKATHAVLGVEVAAATSATSTGAVLRSVTAGGAAAAAGLQAGDVVTKVDTARIADGDDLIAAIRAHAVKDSVTITYTRSGAVHTTKVTLTSATS
jgi:putative serine protease PepD